MLSVLAAQLSAMLLEVVVPAVGVPGAVGGVTSGTVVGGVVTLSGPAAAERLPAASKACTVNWYAVAAARPVTVAEVPVTVWVLTPFW